MFLMFKVKKIAINFLLQSINKIVINCGLWQVVIVFVNISEKSVSKLQYIKLILFI